LDSLLKNRRVVLLIALVAIAGGFMALRFLDQKDKIAGIAAASAAAAAHGCTLNNAEISRLVEQYRNQYDLGWYESGSKVAETIGNDCVGSQKIAPASH
jgi:hypothetical protein